MSNDKDSLAQSLVRITILIIVILVFFAAGVLLWVWNDNMRIEAGKAALQVFVTAIVGTVLGIIVFLFQENHKRNLDAVRRDSDARREDSQRESDARREDSQRESDARREMWMRAVEDIKDERRREDELLRITLDASIAAYNQVKSIRRMLRAETLVGNERRVTSATYAQYMAQLNKLQLEFERLETGAPLLKNVLRARSEKYAERQESPENDPANMDLVDTFDAIQKYLNSIVGEYEENRNKVEEFERAHEGERSGAPGMPLRDGLPKLLDFVGTAIYFHTLFKINKLHNNIQEALLQPVILPSINDGAERKLAEG